MGANGYVGRHLVKRFSRAGMDVSGLVRTEEGAAIVKEAGGLPLRALLDDESAMEEAIGDHERIVWAAQLMIPDEQQFVVKALNWIAGTEKTFVFTSGTGVLSERTDGFWSERTFAEADRFEPRAGIAQRVKTERLVLEAGDPKGPRTIVVRPPAIWGNGGTSIITEIYRSVSRSGAACYMGPGLNCYSNVHVEDLAELYLLALQKAPSGALYHAVSGEMPFKCLAEAVAKHLNVPTRSLAYAEAREIFGPAATAIIFSASSRSQCPRASSELGWVPSPERLDILAECGHPGYVDAAQKVGAWVTDKDKQVLSHDVERR